MRLPALCVIESLEAPRRLHGNVQYCDCWDTVTLRLADDGSLSERIAGQYDQFAVSQISNASEISISVEPGPPYVPLDISRIFYIHTAVVSGRVEFTSYHEMGWFDPAAGRGELVLRPQGNPENYMRVLYAWLCLRNHALFAARQRGHTKGARVCLFGHSGNGKTTVSRLSPGGTVLSDDMVIVRKERDQWRLHGVPFRGEALEVPRTNASADLAGVFGLTKAAAHAGRPMQCPRRSREYLLVSRLSCPSRATPRVWWPPVNDLVASVPARMLHFRLDPGFWELIA